MPNSSQARKLRTYRRQGIANPKNNGSDRESLPLCGLHHTWGMKSHHRLGKSFWRVHGLNRAYLISELNRMYKES